MAATDSPETTTTAAGPETPRATASPLDQHTPPTASTGERSGRATTAMILGIISIPALFIPILGVILGVIAIVLGATARGEIRRRGMNNSGQALAGIICGAIGVLLSLGNWIATAIMVSS